jgi:hypothetical protein
VKTPPLLKPSGNFTRQTQTVLKSIYRFTGQVEMFLNLEKTILPVRADEV